MPRPWPGLSLAKNRNNDIIIKLINMLGEWLKTTYTCKKCLHNYLVTNNVNKNGYVFLQFRVLATTDWLLPLQFLLSIRPPKNNNTFFNRV